MSDPDDAVYEGLIQRLADGDETARDLLRALANRRAAEADAEREAEAAIIAESFGSDPTIGTRVEDGGTIHSPPGFTDADSAFVTMPDGRAMAKEHLLAGRPSDPTDPSGPPSFDGPPAA